MKKIFALTFLIISTLFFSQEKRPVLDIMLTNYQYPYDVHFFEFQKSESGFENGLYGHQTK